MSFFKKPLNFIQLFLKEKINPELELKRILGDFNLPSFPVASLNVIKALRNPSSSNRYIEEILESDPGLHVKVLKTVNSAAFGLRGRITSIHHAIGLLGRRNLENIVLSHAVNSSLPKIKLPFFDMNQFWSIASFRACLARVLARRLHPKTHMESFTAGLLQDMALPILITNKTKQYRNIIEQWNNYESNIIDLENEELGYDHAYAGGLIASKWNLPTSLIYGIAGHHTDIEEDEVEPAVKIVSYIRTNNSEDIDAEFFHVCIDQFGMTKRIVEEILVTGLEKAEELSLILR